jgi:sigma-B regulation protein RsbU (phosphoserine phosphatase)
MFATAFAGVYEAAARRLVYSLAGHPLPLLRRRNRGVSELDRTPGLPLGILERDDWAEKEVQLWPGDALLLFTDGLVEGTNKAGEMFGAERLLEAMRLGPVRARRLAQHVEWHFKHFRGDAPDLESPR